MLHDFSNRFLVSNNLSKKDLMILVSGYYNSKQECIGQFSMI